VQSILGSNLLGYLVLAASPAVFALQCPGTFEVPPNPGQTVTVPVPPPMAAVLSVITALHKEDLRIFYKYNNVDKSCKKSVTRLVPEMYYRTLTNRYTGFANRSCLEILTHLWIEYGTLTDKKLQDKDRKLKSEISGEILYEELLLQIKDCVEAVVIQNPYTPAQIVSIEMSLVEATGYCNEGCKEWK